MVLEATCSPSSVMCDSDNLDLLEGTGVVSAHNAAKCQVPGDVVLKKGRCVLSCTGTVSPPGPLAE